MATYRAPEESYDETHDGDHVSFSETFSVCVDCGDAVYDIDAHDKHHELLARIERFLSSLPKE